MDLWCPSTTRQLPSHPVSVPEVSPLFWDPSEAWGQSRVGSEGPGLQMVQSELWGGGPRTDSPPSGSRRLRSAVGIQVPQRNRPVNVLTYRVQKKTA